jgi:hypothetical protein
LLQFLQGSSTDHNELLRDCRSIGRAVVAAVLHNVRNGEDYPMRHSEPSPGIHNVDVPGMTPSLEQVESDPARFRCVALPLLLPGTLVTLHTRNTCYRLVVIDGSERRIQISGGKLFSEGTEAELIGATDDEGVKVGWIIEGFQLELLTARGPVLTSTVESVDVE